MLDIYLETLKGKMLGCHLMENLKQKNNWMQNSSVETLIYQFTGKGYVQKISKSVQI